MTLRVGRYTPYIREEEEAGQPKANILPSILQTGKIVSDIGMMNKTIQANKLKRTGILEDMDFTHTWNPTGKPGDVGYDEFAEKVHSNVWRPKADRGPDWFKSAGNTVELDPRFIGEKIPDRVINKYGLDPNATWSHDNAGEILRIQKHDPKFIKQATSKMPDKLFDLGGTERTNIAGAGHNAQINVGKRGNNILKPSYKTGKEAWKEGGKMPFMSMPTNPRTAEYLAANPNASVGGPASQFIKAFGQTTAKGGPGFFKFLAPGKTAAGAKLAGTASAATGAGTTAATAGGAPAGLFAGMTPLGWAMLGVSLLSSLKPLKKLFKF
tara:strand:+ start:270 stop:1244 length:975 start_codon:yes stop_codon:yes gene_type:complete